MKMNHMKMPHLDKTQFNPRRGAMLVLVLLVIVILLVCAVFTVDVAQMHLARAELRTATDAAARAGSEALARTQNQEIATQAAIEAAARNSVFNEGLQLRREDVIFGSQAPGNNGGGIDFVAGQQPFSAVQVLGRRDALAPQGRIPLLFANIFGVSDFGPVQTATAAASVRDIALVLDRSGSMRLDAGGTTRLDALKEAVEVFIAEVQASSPNSRISLISYSTNASTDLRLTDNFNTVSNQVENFDANGFTNIFEALRLGSNSLLEANGGREFSNKSIILMTDGNFNVGGDPTPSAQLAAGRNHDIHTITFSNGANQQIMQDVAGIGGGNHIHADNGDDLADAFREIARSFSVTLIQ